MMHNLMMDLLDFAQIQKNTFKLNKEYFDLFDIIQQAFFMVLQVIINFLSNSLKFSDRDSKIILKLHMQENQ